MTTVCITVSDSCLVSLVTSWLVLLRTVYWQSTASVALQTIILGERSHIYTQAVCTVFSGPAVPAPG